MHRAGQVAGSDCGFEIYLALAKGVAVNRLILICLLAISLPAYGIVIRHDVDDSKYRVATTEFPALVDLPGEGHGILIAPQ